MSVRAHTHHNHWRQTTVSPNLYQSQCKTSTPRHTFLLQVNPYLLVVYYMEGFVVNFECVLICIVCQCLHSLTIRVTIQLVSCSLLQTPIVFKESTLHWISTFSSLKWWEINWNLYPQVFWLKNTIKLELKLLKNLSITHIYCTLGKVCKRQKVLAVSVRERLKPMRSHIPDFPLCLLEC